MSQITEQIESLRKLAKEIKRDTPYKYMSDYEALTQSVKNKLADQIEGAADTIEGLSEKLRTSQYSDAEIQKMQDMEQAEIEKAYELGRMEHEPCEDEYIKVPKKALKYRTAGMVAYNAEWLKNHFDMERTVICGEQEPCDVAISRTAALDCLTATKLKKFDFVLHAREEIKKLPPVAPQQKTGKWIIVDDCERFIAKCSECGRIEDSRMINKYPYCHCGAKMQEVEE